MTSIARVALAIVDRVIFRACELSLIPWLRMGFAILLTINALVWMQDATRWFTDDGVLTTTSAQEVNAHLRWSLLFYFPSTPAVVHTCLAILLANCVLLFIGCWSRLQMLCIFVWLITFQHRNPILCDAEDTLMRCFAFFMLFAPLDCGWSVTRNWRQSRGLSVPQFTLTDTWAISLIQFQMTIIYLSATWSKLWGSTWQDGTALYYVSHMSDLFGRMPALTPMFDQLWFVKLLTWSVVVIEGVLPIVLWIPRTRRWAVALGIALHLGIELTMTLFLFEWLMILGLISFLGRPSSSSSYQIGQKD